MREIWPPVTLGMKNMQILGSVGGIGGTHSWKCESATISEALWSTVFFFFLGGVAQTVQAYHSIFALPTACT